MITATFPHDGHFNRRSVYNLGFSQISAEQHIANFFAVEMKQLLEKTIRATFGFSVQNCIRKVSRKRLTGNRPVLASHTREPGRYTQTRFYNRLRHEGIYHRQHVLAPETLKMILNLRKICNMGCLSWQFLTRHIEPRMRWLFSMLEQKISGEEIRPRFPSILWFAKPCATHS
ncbi:hypothetical protein RLDS_11925 [Sphingobium lactosutens DS20]|uniref:Uncharacterized protein n=1 Tax=Sphingobium lactosutens DS20 TaxID=1331060 RepID=T0ISS9_9SPHN|nr:hypothetical protein RLDS_11925 [Sphingobium lactosutens DS20]